MIDISNGFIHYIFGSGKMTLSNRWKKPLSQNFLFHCLWLAYKAVSSFNSSSWLMTLSSFSLTTNKNTSVTNPNILPSFFVDLLVKLWRIHPLQSYGWGNPPATGWRSVVLLGSTCFPMDKVCMQEQAYEESDKGHIVWWCIGVAI